MPPRRFRRRLIYASLLAPFRCFAAALFMLIFAARHAAASFRQDVASCVTPFLNAMLHGWFHAHTVILPLMSLLLMSLPPLLDAAAWPLPPVFASPCRLVYDFLPV